MYILLFACTEVSAFLQQPADQSCTVCRPCFRVYGVPELTLHSRDVGQELSLLAGGGNMHKAGSEDLSGVAQFASAMSVPQQDGQWSARFNTFPMATSLPVPAPQPIRCLDAAAPCTVFLLRPAVPGGCNLQDRLYLLCMSSCSLVLRCLTIQQQLLRLAEKGHTRNLKLVWTYARVSPVVWEVPIELQALMYFCWCIERWIKVHRSIHPNRTSSNGASDDRWSAQQSDNAKSRKAGSLKDRIRAGALAKTVGWGSKADEPLPEPLPAAMGDTEQQPLAPQKQYAANIGSVVRALTRSRANGELLHEPEWQAYEDAIASGRCACLQQLSTEFCASAKIADCLGWKRPGALAMVAISSSVTRR